LGDLTEFLESLIAHDDDAAPSLFLCGHSMGGAIALTYAALGPPAMRSHIRGYVISSPLLALHPSYVPPLPLRVLLSVGSRLFPHLQIPQKIDPEVMSRDPEVQKAFKEDKLGHGIGTPEGMWGMLERGKALMDGKVGMDAGVRVWVGHGTADQLTSWEASKKWVEEVLDSRDKELKLYDGWRHRRSFAPHSLFISTTQLTQKKKISARRTRRR
jgi:acylglycerol lipase